MLGCVHDGQLAISSDDVAGLIADQLPALAGLDIVRIDGAGTVNAIFRVGESVTARFPLRHADPEGAAHRLRREAIAAAEFVSASPVPTPEPHYVGRPGHGYPMPWSTQTWLSGSTASPTSLQTSAALAVDLAGLIAHLRGWDTRGRRFAGPGRGGRLSDHDMWVEECISRSGDLVDVDAVRTLWSRFRVLPREDADGMCHGDLIPSNVLVSEERLVGVLDTGGFRAADPALDLVAGWHLLDETSREQMRLALGCSDLQWERGAAWAFEQAIGAYWYYRESNLAMADMGRTTLERLVNSYL